MLFGPLDLPCDIPIHLWLDHLAWVTFQSYLQCASGLPLTFVFTPVLTIACLALILALPMHLPLCFENIFVQFYSAFASTLFLPFWQESVANQSQIIIEQWQQIQQLAGQVEHLTEGLSLLMNKASALTPSIAMLTIPKPCVYSGDPDSCKGFMVQCKMYFEAYLNINEACKYTTFLTMLSREALKGASAVFNNEKEKYSFYCSFYVSVMCLITLQRGKPWVNNC